jgi:hypothetical protein
MPEIQRGIIDGCCVAANWFDLGGAHGKYRSETLEEFALKFLSLGVGTVNYAWTNPIQQIEREYLEAIGFKEVHVSKHAVGNDDYIHLHAADADDLTKGLEPFREILKQRQEEKRLKAMEAAKKKQEELFGIAQEYFKKTYGDKLPEKVTAQEVLQWCVNIPTTCDYAVMAQSFFGIEGITDFRPLTGFTRRWSYAGEVAKGINTRLETIRKREKK